MNGSYEPGKPLSLDWRATDLDWLPEPPEARNRREHAAMMVIMFDACMEYCGQARPITYSRNRNHYAGKGRYQGSLYRYTLIVPAVDKLAEAGLIDHWKAPVAGGPTGRQSEFKASPLLIEALPNEPPLHWVEPGELVRLKDADGNLIPYQDSLRTVRDRRMLREINEAISGFDLDINAPSVERNGQILMIGEDSIYLARNHLYRVFNGGWSLGGRLYGPWWQNCRRVHRPFITINGEPTVEPDYEQLHPRLLYGHCGHILDSNAYTVPGFKRADGKLAWNVLLNASTRQKAVMAIANTLGDSAEIENCYYQAVRLVEALEKRHAPISEYFGSGFGLRLQNIDAGMAEHVMRKTLKQGIPCLPVHDSFITPERHEDVVLEAMDEAFERATKKPQISYN